jgi:hypothetical protein
VLGSIFPKQVNFSRGFVVSIERFRRQRAVDIKTAGSYVLPNWYDPQGKLRTFACRTTRVSPFRMIVDVPVVGKIGDTLTSYFQDFGNLQGQISDVMTGGFLLELNMTQAMRARMADKLVWLEKKHKNAAIIDSRKDARFVPKSPHSRVTLADGSVYACFIIDVSMSGIAVSSEIQPPIATPLAVGACVGRVIRHVPNGFAVKFVKKQDRDELNALLAKEAPF